MRNIRVLSKTLSHTEYKTALALFDEFRSQDFSLNETIAMIYRYGVLDGKELQKIRHAEAERHKKMQLHSQSEAKTEPETEGVINE